MSSRKASTSAKTIETPDDPASQRFTIGKIDAGIAVLISDSVHLIEFPSLLLPSGVGPGSIVNISCTRNTSAEKAAASSFWSLQKDILAEFGEKEPQPPKLRIRNTTQTSVTLEWDKLELASAKLLSLAIWRNKERLTTIPNPLNNTSTKLSGLALATDYNFHLVLKTTAGTFTSNVTETRTHTIADTSGVSVCWGTVEPSALLEQAEAALQTMGGKGTDKIQIDTTHFVATSAAGRDNPSGGAGVEYQKALQLSIPVVSPDWLIACAAEHKMVPIANYYSIGQHNLAASLSSATLVKSTPQLASGRPAGTTAAAGRRAAAVEENAAPTAPVALTTVAETEVEPEAPPADQTVLAEEEPESPPAEEVATPTAAAVEAEAVEAEKEAESGAAPPTAATAVDEPHGGNNSPVPTMIFTEHVDEPVEEPEQPKQEEDTKVSGEEPEAPISSPPPPQIVIDQHEEPDEDEEVVELGGGGEQSEAAGPYEGVDEDAFDASESMEEVGL